jgi:endonuclease G, mitochondrial
LYKTKHCLEIDIYKFKKLMILNIKKLLFVCLLPLLGVACNANSAHFYANGIDEDFEDNGTKGKYEAATVTFKTGAWLLDNALVGSSEQDAHNGNRSIRLKQGGKLAPQFAISGKLEAITFQYATYGEKDQNGTIEVWYSIDAGANWQKAGEVTTDSHDFAAANISITQKGNVRIELRNASRKGCRINIDDVVFVGKKLTAAPFDSAPSADNNNENTTVTPPTKKPKHSKNNTATHTLDAASEAGLAEHLLLGNPTGATADVKNYDNYLMPKREYVLSYNRSRGTPNWVAWHGSAAWNGTVQRSNDFRPDTDLPQSWFRASPNDYKNSGFDRGHLCSSGDRDNDAASNSVTFLMTNIVPQAPNNNQGAWNALELYCRNLIDTGNELYTYAGVYGRGGEGKNGKVLDIADGQIIVPAYTWKVVVVLPEGENDLSRITTKTRVIAINMPNTQSVGKDNWRSYLCTVDDLEKILGYDLLSAIPKNVQAVIEARKDE